MWFDSAVLLLMNRSVTQKCAHLAAEYQDPHPGNINKFHEYALRFF